MVSDTTSAKKIAETTGSNAASQFGGYVGSKQNEQVSKDQFLQLLVTQLKNQDPLDPMKSEEFAVNLAQFSQLEQLVSINNKMGDQTADLSSLATYLGHEVVLNSKTMHVENGDAGHLQVNLPTDVTNLDVEVLNSDGQVVDTARFGEIKRGTQTLAVNSLKVSNGDYTFRATATGAGGVTVVDAKVAGVVTGFIPGADPKLIVNGAEISPGSVLEVGIPPS